MRNRKLHLLVGLTLLGSTVALAQAIRPQPINTGGGGGGGSGTVSSATIGDLAVYTGSTTVDGSAVLTFLSSVLTVDGGALFNGSNADLDFIVAGDVKNAVFSVDAGLDRVGVNRAAGTHGASLDVDNNATAESPLIIRDNGTAVFSVVDSGEAVFAPVAGHASHALTVTGGALLDTARSLQVTGTMPGTLTGSGTVARIDATMPATPSASENYFSGRMSVAHGTNNSINSVLGWFIENATINAAVAQRFQFAGSAGGVPRASMGIHGTAYGASTTGPNYGVSAEASGSSFANAAGFFRAIDVGTGSKVGVLGFAKSTSGTQNAGYFTLSDSDPSFTSAALLADNGAQAVPIARFRDDGSASVFSQFNDGGGMTLAGATTDITSNTNEDLTITSNGTGATKIIGTNSTLPVQFGDGGATPISLYMDFSGANAMLQQFTGATPSTIRFTTGVLSAGRGGSQSSTTQVFCAGDGVGVTTDATGFCVYGDGLHGVGSASQQAITIADSGGGGAANDTTQPTSSHIEITCNDADGCTYSPAETTAVDGWETNIINVGTNTVTMTAVSNQVVVKTGTGTLLAGEMSQCNYTGSFWSCN